MQPFSKLVKPALRTAMPGYLTKQENVAVAGVVDLIVCSLLDRQQYFDPLGEAQRLGISSATWPLFGQLWPSGTKLAALIAQHPVMPDERILELGCGLALPSLVAHRRGANVTASDCHPLTHEFLLNNLSLNHLPPLPYRQGQWTDPRQPDAPGLTQDIAHVQGLFDLIIGSDVLYERDSNAMLASFIVRHASPTAQVWVVDPDRGNRSAFNRQMHERGFDVVQRRLDGPATARVPAYKGRLLIYTRQ